MIDCWLLVDGNDNVAIDDKAGVEFWLWPIPNPVRGVRGLHECVSSFNAAGVGSCCLATNNTGVTAPATELNARR